MMPMPFPSIYYLFVCFPIFGVNGSVTSNRLFHLKFLTVFSASVQQRRNTILSLTLHLLCFAEAKRTNCRTKLKTIEKMTNDVTQSVFGVPIENLWRKPGIVSNGIDWKTLPHPGYAKAILALAFRHSIFVRILTAVKATAEGPVQA